MIKLKELKKDDIIYEAWHTGVTKYEITKELFIRYMSHLKKDIEIVYVCNPEITDEKERFVKTIPLFQIDEKNLFRDYDRAKRRSDKLKIVHDLTNNDNYDWRDYEISKTPLQRGCSGDRCGDGCANYYTCWC